MSTVVFRLECLCPLKITPIVEGYSHEEEEEEVEDFVVEGLVQGSIEVEVYHVEGSEVVEVEGLLLLLLKWCREGWLCIGLAVCMFRRIIRMGFFVSLPGTVTENRQDDIHVFMSIWVGPRVGHRWL